MKPNARFFIQGRHRVGDTLFLHRCYSIWGREHDHVLGRSSLYTEYRGLIWKPGTRYGAFGRRTHHSSEQFALVMRRIGVSCYVERVGSDLVFCGVGANLPVLPGAPVIAVASPTLLES